MEVPSGYDVLAVAGHGDGDGFPVLRRWLVGDFSADLAMLDLVAVEIRVDHEIVDALEVHVRVRLHESLGSVHSPFACDFNEQTNHRATLKRSCRMLEHSPWYSLSLSFWNFESTSLFPFGHVVITWNRLLVSRC